MFVQRALIHLRVGRFEDALADSRRALPLLRRVGDRLNEARLLSNRGILHAYRSELSLAEADLTKALRLYRLLESEIATAQVLHNLGYVSALKGDIPAARWRATTRPRRSLPNGVWVRPHCRSTVLNCCCPHVCCLKLAPRLSLAWRAWKLPGLRWTWLRRDCC